jgi:hypothetical protein
MPLPIPNPEDALNLYVALHGQAWLVLAPDFQNVPTLVPQPQLLRAAYLRPQDAADDHLVSRASSRLDNTWPLLVLLRPSLDGPPSRTAVVFDHRGEEAISWRVDSMTRHGLRVQSYSAALSTGSAGWNNLATSGGPIGYFLTGTAEASELWRIARLEQDVARRLIFTLMPKRLALGLPQAQFTAISDAVLRAEAEQHWSDFRHLVGHHHYALVTSAKNIAETILPPVHDSGILAVKRGLLGCVM